MKESKESEMKKKVLFYMKSGKEVLTQQHAQVPHRKRYR